MSRLERPGGILLPCCLLLPRPDAIVPAVSCRPDSVNLTRAVVLHILLRTMSADRSTAIKPLTQDLEKRIQRNPLLHIDTFIIPSPYIKDRDIEKDYSHSYVWIEEGEILGYLLVYSDIRRQHFNIYKLVTSPFARGRGIGTLFIEHLAKTIPEGAAVYLYLWEKQTDTLDFFQNKGFVLGKTIVYRNLVYYHLNARREDILSEDTLHGGGEYLLSEEIGRTRHDARKTVRLLSHMVDMLSIENCGKIIEDINRETTTLINVLNAFRDTMNRLHEVNLKELILERIIPYVEASSVSCELRLILDTPSSLVLGYYVNFGRALVNIVSNSLEAIQEKGDRGLLEIEMREQDNGIMLVIRDNGSGIPSELLNLAEDGIPMFVGRTTKNRKEGEGLGTVQIFSTFGAENIEVRSEEGVGTEWIIRFQKPSKGMDKGFVRLERRFNEFKRLSENVRINAESSRNDVITYIWQMRKMEIFLFDLILNFGKYHNIRVIYRTILSFFMGQIRTRTVRSEINSYRSDYPQLKSWLLDITFQLKDRLDHFSQTVDASDYTGALFKSYGQAIENVIIFTLDPESGSFLSTDRKLAEHLDLAAYLHKDKQFLLRGEFIGDMNNHNQPIFLGVWSVVSDADLLGKLRLIQQGVKKLMQIGIHREKKLSFYQTTYIQHSRDIDSDATTTFGEFSELTDEELLKYTRQADDELQGMLGIQD